ncbi:hypothetical protein [Enterovirga sp.]|uniref:hypothetical protein n=1 Tax=Enterovirga sp. TaxID=2026350 RepID=UPI0026016565|nr:hypothetical protein [Enterovirga sp.]
MRLALAAGILAGLGGCVMNTATYTIDRYGMTTGVPVTLRCRDTYEVFDRPDLRTLIVTTNVLSETLGGCLEGTPRADRQRQVARLFFQEKTNRPLCVITDERDLTGRHREFTYRCPADPNAQPPRLPARR